MRLLKGNIEVVAPISAPILQIVPMPAQATKHHQPCIGTSYQAHHPH